MAESQTVSSIEYDLSTAISKFGTSDNTDAREPHSASLIHPGYPSGFAHHAGENGL